MFVKTIKIKKNKKKIIKVTISYYENKGVSSKMPVVKKGQSRK